MAFFEKAWSLFFSMPLEGSRSTVEFVELVMAPSGGGRRPRRGPAPSGRWGADDLADELDALSFDVPTLSGASSLGVSGVTIVETPTASVGTLTSSLGGSAFTRSGAARGRASGGTAGSVGFAGLGRGYSNANQVKLAEQNKDYTRPRVRGKFWRARAELHVEPRTPTI